MQTYHIPTLQIRENAKFIIYMHVIVSRGIWPFIKRIHRSVKNILCPDWLKLIKCFWGIIISFWITHQPRVLCVFGWNFGLVDHKNSVLYVFCFLCHISKLSPLGYRPDPLFGQSWIYMYLCHGHFVLRTFPWNWSSAPVVLGKKIFSNQYVFIILINYLP